MRRAIFIHSAEIDRFPYPPEFPFNISRAGKVRQIVNSMGLLSGAGRSEVVSEPAQRMSLKKFHSARYLNVLKRASDGHFEPEALGMGIGTPDCPVFKGMYEGAVLACGGTVGGVNLILSGSADAVFNPSGGLHHAGSERAAGFCYINDVAIGCALLAEAGKKVLYLDIDVHHGDGVASAFYESSDVMTISLHQTGRTLFPGTGFEDEIGRGEGKGYCVNVPLPVGTYDEAYMKAFKAIAQPLITAFGPDVIVLQLGADGLAEDPLAHLHLTNNVYAEIISSLLGLGKPILATGGGGYNVRNTVRAWALDWCVLCGADTEQKELRDSEQIIHSQQQGLVLGAIDATIEQVKAKVFCFHGL